MRIRRAELRQYIQFLLELERNGATDEAIIVDTHALHGVSWWQAALLDRLDRDAALFRVYVSMVLADLNVVSLQARLDADRLTLQRDLPIRLGEIEAIAERSLDETKALMGEAHRIEAEIETLERRIGNLLDRIVGHPTCALRLFTTAIALRQHGI
jgi:hypothetical protein